MFFFQEYHQAPQQIIKVIQPVSVPASHHPQIIKIFRNSPAPAQNQEPHKIIKVSTGQSSKQIKPNSSEKFSIYENKLRNVL